MTLDATLTEAVAELAQLSKYTKKLPRLRQRIRGPHSLVMARIGHAMANEQGLTILELPAVLETLDKLISPHNQALLSQLTAQPSTTPAALALFSMAQHLVLLLGASRLPFPASGWIPSL